MADSHPNHMDIARKLLAGKVEVCIWRYGTNMIANDNRIRRTAAPQGIKTLPRRITVSREQLSCNKTRLCIKNFKLH